MSPAVFLDRDNTLIANDGDLGDPAHVRLLEGVARGLKQLHEAGYRLVVVTNQAGVARGSFSEADVDRVHQRIATLVDLESNEASLIDRFYYCPYHPDATVEAYRRDHPWRKPHPGMLIQAAHDMNLDLARCWMIGDRVRDVDAGRSAGCRTVLVSERDDETQAAHATVAVTTFEAAVAAILEKGAAGVRPSNGAPSVRGRMDHPGSAGHPDAFQESFPGAGAGASTLEGRAPSGAAGALAGGDALRRAIVELRDELRADRERRPQLTPLRVGALIGQLLAILLAIVAILHLDSGDLLFRWGAGAFFVQLLTITALLVDHRA